MVHFSKGALCLITLGLRRSLVQGFNVNIVPRTVQPSALFSTSPIDEAKAVAVREEMMKVRFEHEAKLRNNAAAPEEAAKEKEEEGVKLFVGNLPFETTPAEISQMFSEHGKVLKLAVPRDRETGNRRGFAFVTMETQEMAEAAVAAMKEYTINDRNINVSISLPVGQAPPNRRKKEFTERTKIYIGNMPFDTTEDALKELFSEYGTVHDSYIPTDRETGRSRGFGFITMEKDEANAAMEKLEGFVYDGRELIVNESVPKGSQPKTPRRKVSRNQDNMRRLYVGNLSFDADDEILMDLFTEFGNVKEIFMPTWPDTGRPKGFAFVTMEAEAADRALEETDGLEFLGRNIRVNEAAKRSSNRRPFRDDSDDEEF